MGLLDAVITQDRLRDAAIRLHDALYWLDGGVQAILAMPDEAASAYADLQRLLVDARATGDLPALHPRIAVAARGRVAAAEQAVNAECAAVGVAVDCAAKAWPEIRARLDRITRIRARLDRITRMRADLDRIA